MVDHYTDGDITPDSTYNTTRYFELYEHDDIDDDNDLPPSKCKTVSKISECEHSGHLLRPHFQWLRQFPFAVSYRSP